MRALLLREKHEKRVVAINGETPHDLHIAALKIVTERLNDGYWYDNWDEGDPATQWEDRAKEIVAADNGKAAWDFLSERDDHEYEGVEVVTSDEHP